MADADQNASDTDQRASDRDQAAADRDQAASDRAHLGTPVGPEYDGTRRARAQSSLERDVTSQARSEDARIRNETAARRDRIARERDAVARARDLLAARMDAQLEQLEQQIDASEAETNGSLPAAYARLRATADRKRAAASRSRAAEQRAEAALDRERAAEDRRQAALDRRAAADELALEGTDYLTGALRRRVGIAAIRREMDRTLRTGEPLVMAFVDVDGLKQVNDLHNHAAGDDLLRAVVRSIAQHLRSYDVVARFGGDEFICSLAGQNVAGARARFRHISTRIAEAADGATVTVGLAERQPEDSVHGLIHRADIAMLEERRRARN